MKYPESIRSANFAQQRPGRHRSPIALALSALFLAAGASAADAPPASQPATMADGEVVVSGIRISVENSISVKRESDSIIEAVSAEDIGKLPDTSIAESLARLPGVTVQRVNGRDQVISIRGMDERYAVTLLNGREMVSTGDNRSVEYDQFPAELINAAIVYKTPDAALGAQGLSGTVNMKTISPLDLTSRRINFNVRGERNSNGELVPGTKGNGNRLSFSYVDQFADNTIGVALGFAHLDTPAKAKFFNPEWWGSTSVWGLPVNGLGTGNQPSTQQGVEQGVLSINSKRDGVMGVFEYKPSHDFRSQLDVYWSKFNQSTAGRDLITFLSPNAWNLGTSDPIYSNVGTTLVNGNWPIVTSGSIANVDPILSSRSDERKDEIKAFGWNTEFTSGSWTTSLDVSYSKAERSEVMAEAYASATTMSGFSSFYANPGFGFSQYTPSLDYGSSSVVQLRGVTGWWSPNDPASVGGIPPAGSLSPIAIDDEMKAIRLSTKSDLEFGPISGFEGGVNLSHRSKDTARSQLLYALKNGTPCVNSVDVCSPIPAGILQSPANLGFVGIPSLVSFDTMAALNSGAYDSYTVNLSDSPGRNWYVKENVTTAFGKLNLKFSAGIPVHGNVGLQLIRTKQEAGGIGWDPVNSVIVPGVTYSKTYNDVLPSLNLIGEINASTFVRLGAAKTLARPNMDDMRAGITAQLNPPSTPGAAYQWSGSGGNPGLEPWRATSFDLSFEKYFGKRSYVSAAVFRKNLKTSIYPDTINFDFSGYSVASGHPSICQVGQTNCQIGRLDAPANGQGGKIDGIELSSSVDFGMLARPLDGIGAILTYSHNRSDIAGHDQNGNKDLTRSLEGLSGNVYSVTAYYERNGWSARVANRYRSRYVAQVRGVWINTSYVASEADHVTDAQLAYAWESGRLKGLSIELEVGNLTNTPDRTSLNDDSYSTVYGGSLMLPSAYREYGRRYLFGFGYKF